MMKTIRAWLKSRTGRLLQHDLLTAAAAGLAVVEGSNSVSEAVLKAAGIVAVRKFARSVYPIPSK